MLFFGMIFSLHAKSEFNIHQKKIINDSLQHKTLDELTVLFWRGKDLDTITKARLRDAYMAKAKENGDPVKIADGYQMFMYMYKGKYDMQLNYSDSIINITRDLENHHYPATGYIFKGNALKATERYNEALETFLQAKEIAEKNKFGSQTINVEFKIAELKTILGKNQEAFKTYNKYYKSILKNESWKSNDQFYISTVHKLADIHNRMGKYDSAYFYIDLGIERSLSSPYRYHYPGLVFTSGVNSYYRDEYRPAIDSLQKTLSLLDHNPEDVKVRMSYLYLGKSYIRLKDDAKAFIYLKKVDSTTNHLNYRYELREAFELLQEYYSKTNNRAELVKVLEKWIRYERIREEKYNQLDNSIVSKYDVPKLVKEKEQLLEKATKSSKNVKIGAVVLGVSLVTVLGLFYFIVYKRKKRGLEIALDEQMEKVKQLESNTKKPNNSASLELSEEIKLEILQKLNKFETDLGYLKNNLTQVKVSKKLNTNSTYLSKVINLEKGKNFTNYINDLRIAYCIEQIKADTRFRQYSISSMAKEVGFNNIQSFAKAFSKKTNMNPAEYVKKYELL